MPANGDSTSPPRVRTGSPCLERIRFAAALSATAAELRRDAETLRAQSAALRERAVKLLAEMRRRLPGV
jgi:hypothetical protein